MADVSQAFSQGLRGQRPQPLFATAPPGGIPGEDDDILIEVCAEIYGPIYGPPGWRRSLLTTLKGLGFKNHPLAPCVVLMYDDDNNPKCQAGNTASVSQRVMPPDKQRRLNPHRFHPKNLLESSALKRTTF